MEREDKRGIFFGVIGVLTLIVAIIGASLAYFSINAGSKENALSVQAATVQIVYTEGDALLVTDIIPSTKAIALETYRRYLAGETYKDSENHDIPYEECKDDKGYTVCGVYGFTLTNNDTVSAVDITAKVIPTALGENEKGFTNLKFALYDVTSVVDESADFGTELASDTITYTEFNLVTNTVSIPVSSTKKYRLFIWLDEIGDEQDAEQGATFKGRIFVNVANSEGTITGNADKTLGD